MNSAAVIGLGFGDEGKGMVTDLLCRQLKNPIIVRFSGGQQAGHTVYRDHLVSHVFSNFGSGSFRDVPTFWSRFCTMDPVGLMNERRVLNDKGVHPVLYIDLRTPITTPFDIIHNQKTELQKRQGSCGVGVGATWEREENHYSLLFEDLYFPLVLDIKLAQIRNYYKENAPLDDFLEAVHCITHCPDLRPASEEILEQYPSIIFEGSQGLLLDQRYGFFPNVTRSNTGMTNIIAMGHRPNIYLVTRAYQTRHGIGPMTNETLTHSIRKNPEEVNEMPSPRGPLRKAILDIDLLRYAIQKDPVIRDSSNKTLIITCLDNICDEYRYTINGACFRSESETAFVSTVQTHLGIRTAHAISSPAPPLIDLTG